MAKNEAGNVLATEVSAADVCKDPVLFLAFGLGSGLAPKAPGTAGSLLAILLYPLLAMLPLPAYILFVVVFAVVGIWICGRACEKLGVHDHGGIVIDEVAGVWLAMTAMPVTIPTLIAGFVLFRFFDIVKPWPIGMLDKRIHGGLGVMLDDLVAGCLTWVVLVAAQMLIGGFGI